MFHVEHYQTTYTDNDNYLLCFVGNLHRQYRYSRILWNYRKSLKGRVVGVLRPLDVYPRNTLSKIFPLDVYPRNMLSKQRHWMYIQEIHYPKYSLRCALVLKNVKYTGQMHTGA